MLAIVGAFTTTARHGRGRGLRSFRVDGGWEALDELVCVNPSYLARHPRHHDIVYASHSDGSHISAVQVDRHSGALRLLGQQATGGFNAAHLAVTPDGTALLVASFGSGNISAFPLAPNGGLRAACAIVDLHAVGGSQPHQISFSPSGRHVLVPDRGADRIWVLQRKATRSGWALVGHAPAMPDSGPRHLDWHPRLPIVYVLNELDSTLSIYRWHEPAAALKPVRTLPTLPPGHAGRSIAAAVRVSHDGRFLYASHRGHDSVAVLAITGDGLALTSLGWQTMVGASPRFIDLDARGHVLWVAAHDSDAISGLRIDAASGRLTPLQTVATPSPTCIVFI